MDDAQLLDTLASLRSAADRVDLGAIPGQHEQALTCARARALGALGAAAATATEAVLAGLLVRLHDPDADMRMVAAEALGALGAAAATEAVLAGLLARLHDPDADVRRAVARPLVKLAESGARYFPRRSRQRVFRAEALARG